MLALSRRALAMILFAIVGVSAGLYIYLVNVRVTKGFEIKSLEKRIAELAKEQKSLQRQAAELQSMQTIEQHIDLNQFIPAQSVSYIQESGVASSR